MVSKLSLGKHSEKFQNLLARNKDSEDSSSEEASVKGEPGAQVELGIQEPVIDRQEHVTTNLLTSHSLIAAGMQTSRHESNTEISLIEELENIQLQRSRLLELIWLDVKEGRIRAILNGLH